MQPHFRIMALYALIALYLSEPVEGQEQFGLRYNISHVTMEDGLLSDLIDHIYKDSRGFLWIATEGGGLSRYDGYEFAHYNISSSTVRVSSNFVKCCCEDAFGRCTNLLFTITKWVIG